MTSLLTSSIFDIDVLKKEKIIDKNDKGVCEVKDNILIIPEVHFDIISLYINDGYRLDYINWITEMEIYGYVKKIVQYGDIYHLYLSYEENSSTE